MNNQLDYNEPQNPEAVAIIGMAGRFPGAANVDIFWQNLCQGIDSITRFSEDELQAAGVPLDLLRNPNYVRAKGMLADIDCFDASFFGITPRQATLLDPQHRHFLETTWHALEDAGYDPAQYPGKIGVYAGTGMNTYFVNHAIWNQTNDTQSNDPHAQLGTDKDFLTTLVSYKFNLKGPSIAVQTACSTSLVAVQLAYQSLLTYQCDVALAGGVSIRVPQKSGYLYEEGSILSPDGYCRPFDAKARGTVGGDGVGVVVLKRLDEAVAAGDHIYAVIKGAAINNDGALKVGYTAPSIEGQAEVITMAQALADVDPETITYVEAHGTATALGDPIEVEALTQAFSQQTTAKQFCAIGSLKSNVGHLDPAAGVAGLIKTTLALKHKMIPPSLHFERPNPKIDLEHSPFYVNTALAEWKTNGGPRRAGVSSFGIGGTNAHVVLEEAPRQVGGSPSRAHQLLLLSAKTESSLEAATDQLLQYLQQHPEVNLADAAYTLQVGRKSFEQRWALVCPDRESAVTALETGDPKQCLRANQVADRSPVIFMFSGQGSQYVTMAAELYHTEPAFRAQVDYCADFLKPRLGLDLREVLYPAEAQLETAAEQLRQTALTQPALFVIEYALAKLWQSWGIQPRAMIGHSIGEITAACLAGVFALDEALTLVAERGRLMQSLPEGAMLAVSLPADDIRAALPEGLSLAAINGPAQCVVSGPAPLIESWQETLAAQDVTCQRLHTSHAFHSAMMDPIGTAFTEAVTKLTLRPPQIPFVSNVTSTWITAQEATDPHYWARHLRQTVQFESGVRLLLREPGAIMLEIGPGRTLATLVKQQLAQSETNPVLTSLRHPRDQHSDIAFLLTTLGRLWLAGGTVDWTGYYQHETRRRIPLPGYPFERQRYWVEAKAGTTHHLSPPRPTLSKQRGVSDWFYVPSWKRVNLPDQPLETLFDHQAVYLLLVDPAENSLGQRLAQRLRQLNQMVVTVEPGSHFNRLKTHHFALNPHHPADFSQLCQTLLAQNLSPDRVVHTWPAAQAEANSQLRAYPSRMLGFYSLIYLTQALTQHYPGQPLTINIISSGVNQVLGDEPIVPDRALALGPCQVISQEYPDVICRHLDLVATDLEPPRLGELIPRLLPEMVEQATATQIAYRGRYRWEQVYDNVRLFQGTPAPLRLRGHGVYLITGGLGKVGLTIAEWLVAKVQARLVLLSHSGLPDRNSWSVWLNTHPDDDVTSLRIKKVQALETAGAQVTIVQADVTDLTQMKAMVTSVQQEVGPIQGVVHAAGVVHGAFVPLSELDEAECERQLKPKVEGVQVLANVFRDYPLDFCLLTSSLASILGGIGFAAYAAANVYLDHFAQLQNKLDYGQWITLNWDAWNFESLPQNETQLGVNLARLAMTPAEGVATLDYALNTKHINQLIISTADLQLRMAQWQHPSAPSDSEKAIARHQRPALPEPYVQPRNESELVLVDVWKNVLGFAQIGIHDNFFELGGDSLMLTQLASRIRKLFNEDISMKALFEAATIAEQATLIAQQKAAGLEYATLTELIAGLEGLSDAEIEAALQG